jgi:ribose/xylose/arabinose/galactoside ABC-type transport system permease subunit
MVVVLGMVVLVAGGASWAVLVAVGFCLLGMVGQGITYHYFTDTVGALLLGTAIVCVAALTLRHAPHQT